MSRPVRRDSHAAAVLRLRSRSWRPFVPNILGHDRTSSLNKGDTIAANSNPRSHEDLLDVKPEIVTDSDRCNLHRAALPLNRRLLIITNKRSLVPDPPVREISEEGGHGCAGKTGKFFGGRQGSVQVAIDAGSQHTPGGNRPNDVSGTPAGPYAGGRAFRTPTGCYHEDNSTCRDDIPHKNEYEEVEEDVDNLYEVDDDNQCEENQENVTVDLKRRKIEPAAGKTGGRGTGAYGTPTDHGENSDFADDTPNLNGRYEEDQQYQPPGSEVPEEEYYNERADTDTEFSWQELAALEEENKEKIKEIALLQRITEYALQQARPKPHCCDPVYVAKVAKNVISEVLLGTDPWCTMFPTEDTMKKRILASFYVDLGDRKLLGEFNIEWGPTGDNGGLKKMVFNTIRGRRGSYTQLARAELYSLLGVPKPREDHCQETWISKLQDLRLHDRWRISSGGNGVTDPWGSDAVHGAIARVFVGCRYTSETAMSLTLQQAGFFFCAATRYGRPGSRSLKHVRSQARHA